MIKQFVFRTLIRLRMLKLNFVNFNSQDYDKEGFCRHSIMLKNKQGKSGNQTVNNNEPSPYLPKLTELYLCENCGADYESLDEVMVRYQNLKQIRITQNVISC